jgi:glycosyltransferase involved in cell wall biosynthesis
MFTNISSDSANDLFTEAWVSAPAAALDECPAAGATEAAPARGPQVDTVDYSFVIPLKDEEATLVELYERIAAEFGSGKRFEVILVDDGSRDASWEVIRQLAARDPDRVRGLRFRRNAGKAAALTAGFRAARGEVVFTLDADLQDDPKEIRRFLAKLDQGYDVVSGWKRVRHDPWHKVYPSRVFNRLLSRFSRTELHDHNCGFKCYRAAVPRGLTLYGEMHRMIPALAAIGGFRVAEIEVEHHPRTHGRSKYGFERYLRGFSDMLTVWFLRKYRERPGHFLNGVAVAVGVLAQAFLVAGLVVGADRVAGGTLFVSGVVLVSAALLTFLGGIVAELLIRGGLTNEWRLPVAEDTRLAADPGRERAPTNIPLTYVADRG